MSIVKEQVGFRMKQYAAQWFTAQPLLDFSYSFIEEKLAETMMFGELAVIHYHMFEGKDADIDGAAAAVELFILASDILDDLEDGDAPSKPWMKAPLPVALHVATSLVTLSQQALLHSTSDPVLRGELAVMMNTQLIRSANGQMMDLMNDTLTEEGYFQMVRGKSASLLVMACMAGVLLAGRPWNETVAEYAAELGISAQLRNDCRDLLRWDEKSDFLNRKQTLLTMYLLEGPDEQVGWIRDYYNGSGTKHDVTGKKELFLQACEQSGVELYGSVVSRMHYNRFQELLAELQADAIWKDKLMQKLAGGQTA
ncbi:polyprenyl synthetase family protein [Paenibacillus sp. NPDC057967]|uniref:polyprenyl synthetase family protein n=1 Tax=Paenibacillus sp. NPDC057967 TaxID=3346293 RepID=UPI0036DF5AFF